MESREAKKEGRMEAKISVNGFPAALHLGVQRGGDERRTQEARAMETIVHVRQCHERGMMNNFPAAAPFRQRALTSDSPLSGRAGTWAVTSVDLFRYAKKVFSKIVQMASRLGAFLSFPKIQHSPVTNE